MRSKFYPLMSIDTHDYLKFTNGKQWNSLLFNKYNDIENFWKTYIINLESQYKYLQVQYIPSFR